MKDLLIRNADVVVTMNATRDELSGADVHIRDGVIAAVGSGLSAPGAEVIDAVGCVVTPGLVNTHHHLYQTLTRAVPGGQDALLFGWLKTLYPIWARFGPEEVFTSAQVGLAELALSGCTMTSDHLYLYPNGARLDDTIAAAGEVGLRFHPTRGAMSIGESAGGLPPDALVEREPAILEDMIRVVDRFHDSRPGAMVRVGLAPCSPFSVSRELMRDAALLARDKGVMLHTHLAENDEDIAYSLSAFGCRPGQYAEELGWTGTDVWHAHCVKLDSSEIELFSRSLTGIAHCPCSNCRLGSGIAPVRAMRDAGVKVGLGGGWVRLERRGQPDCRGADGDAVAARGAGGGCDVGARGAGDRDPGGGPGAGAGRSGLGGARQEGGPGHLGSAGGGGGGVLGSGRGAGALRADAGAASGGRGAAGGAGRANGDAGPAAGVGEAAPTGGSAGGVGAGFPALSLAPRRRQGRRILPWSPECA